MTEQHRITPPPSLVEQWCHEYGIEQLPTLACFIADKAAEWGSDQELEACLHWASEWCSAHKVHRLLAARRPKPTSLKQQALTALAAIEGDFNTVGDRADTIRRALEQLDD